MNLKENLKTTLLLTIGLLLHYITPAFLAMKFDFLLIFMFISIFINSSKKNIILTSFLAGLMSAMTTSFPMGQIPNFVDKIATGILFYILLNILKIKLNKFTVPIVALLGTIFSGILFLSMAKFFLGAELKILTLIKFVVIPTGLINSIATLFIYKIILKTIKIEHLQA